MIVIICFLPATCYTTRLWQLFLFVCNLCSPLYIFYFLFFFFQVAWLRVDTQTILTIQNHVITKNHRVGITYSEFKTWQLKVKDLRESDRGWYMCQINTDPMKSQTGFLDVVGMYILIKYCFFFY